MFAAVNALLQGFSLLFRPGLRRYTLAPVGISALILGPGLFWTLPQARVTHRCRRRVATRVAELPRAGHHSNHLHRRSDARCLVLCVTHDAGIWAVSWPVVGARREASYGTNRQRPGERGLIRDVGAAVAREMRKLGFYLPRALGALVLTFVPVLNGLSPVVWFALGAWMMAIQFLDFPQDNRGLPFQATRDLLGRHRIRTLCFGAMVATLLAIPLLGVLVLPAATIGATVLHVRHLRPARPVTP